jgi:GNAT superfamily N-acetyltransferase
MPDVHEVVEVDPHDRSLLEKIGRLRVLAWSTLIPATAAKADCWLDEFELTSRHWCILHEGEPVAAARLSVHADIGNVPDAGNYPRVLLEPLPRPIGCFSRLVVHPDFRGGGLARRLDEVRMAAAQGAGARAVVVVLTPEPPDPRLRRFQERGFMPVGGPLREPPGHYLEGMWAQPLVYRIPDRPLQACKRTCG